MIFYKYIIIYLKKNYIVKLILDSSSEVEELDAKMQEINAALDTLEQKNDCITSQLKEILRENKEERENAILQQQSPDH